MFLTIILNKNNKFLRFYNLIFLNILKILKTKNNNFTLKMHKYRLKKKIGEGTFAEVLMAKNL